MALGAMICEVNYYWVRFYPSAEWQIVKFWQDKNGVEYLKGLDWGYSHKLKDFSNNSYVIGEVIKDKNNI